MINLLDPGLDGVVLSIVGTPGSGISSKLLDMTLYQYNLDPANFLVIKHPLTDMKNGEPCEDIFSINKEKRLSAILAENVKQIMEAYSVHSNEIKPPKNIVIHGVNQYAEQEIATLIDDASRANLNIVLGGIPLQHDNVPYHHIGQLLSISDAIISTHAYCPKCNSPTSRSQRIENGANVKYLPVCVDHHQIPGKPLKSDYLIGKKGKLTVISSPAMFSQKSESLFEQKGKLDRAGILNIVFRPKSYSDLRGKSWEEGKFETHDGQKVDCVHIPTAMVIPAYLSYRSVLDGGPTYNIIIDEGQFLQHIGQVIPDLVYTGNNVIVSLLSKSFLGTPLCEAQNIMPYADVYDIKSAICTAQGCSARARVTQRNVVQDGKILRAAGRDDPLVVIEDAYLKSLLYQPKCWKHNEVPYTPEFSFISVP